MANMVNSNGAKSAVPVQRPKATAPARPAQVARPAQGGRKLTGGVPSLGGKR